MLAPASRTPCPARISGRRADYIRGLGRHRGEIIILLNLAEVLDARDFIRFADDRGAP